MEIVDLYSFEHLELDFTKYAKGTTIILGKNLDLNSSNAAGKSAILRALYFILWGKDLKNVSIKNILRRGVKSGFLGRLIFEDQGIRYKVTRYKEYKNPKYKFYHHPKIENEKNPQLIKGSGLEFVIDDTVLHFEKDAPKLQKVINSKINMSSKIFLESVLTQQSRKSNFLLTPDADKKATLSEILDLTFYEKALKILEKEAGEKQTSLQVLENDILLYKNNIKLKEEENSTLIKNKDTFELKAKERKTNLQLKISTVSEKIINLQKKMKELTTPDSDKELDLAIKELKIKIESLKKDTEKESDLIRLKSTAEEQLKSAQERNLKINKELIALDTQEDKFKKEITQLNYNPDKIKIAQEAIQSALKNISNKNERVKNLEANIVTINKNQQKLSALHQIISQARSNLEKDEKYLIATQEHAKCGECNRGFQSGENDLIDNQIKKYSEKILSHKKTLNQALNKETELNTSINQLENHQTELNTIKNEIETLKSNKSKYDLFLNNQKNILNQRKIHEENLSNIINSRKNFKDELLKNNEKIEENKNKIKKIEPFFVKINGLKSELLSLQEKFSTLSLEQSKIKQSQENFNTIKEQLSQYQESLAELKAESKEVASGKNPFGELIERNIKTILEFSKKMDRASKESEELKNELKYYDFWKIGFSKTGIRSFIIDEILETLNYHTNLNLNILSEGLIGVVFNSESESDKGKITNKISTKYYINGEETVFDLNSGGEAQRAVIAVDLAISALAESRSGTNFNIKFLDEPFDGIDSAGQLKCLALFNSLSEHKEGFFLISHDEKMQAFCNNQIYVMKKDGISRLVDKKTFLSAKITSPGVS